MTGINAVWATVLAGLPQQLLFLLPECCCASFQIDPEKGSFAFFATPDDRLRLTVLLKTKGSLFLIVFAEASFDISAVISLSWIVPIRALSSARAAATSVGD